MNVDITFYLETTGRIVGTGQVPESMRQAQENTVEGIHSGAEKYVDVNTQVTLYDKAVIARPEMPVTLTGLVLEGIPLDTAEPTKLVIDSEGGSTTYDIPGESTVELDFPSAGKYAIRITGFPYIDKKFEVTV